MRHTHTHTHTHTHRERERERERKREKERKRRKKKRRKEEGEKREDVLGSTGCPMCFAQADRGRRRRTLHRRSRRFLMITPHTPLNCPQKLKSQDGEEQFCFFFSIKNIRGNNNKLAPAWDQHTPACPLSQHLQIRVASRGVFRVIPTNKSATCHNSHTPPPSVSHYR